MRVDSTSLADLLRKNMRFMKYLAAGLLNTVLTYGLYLLLLNFLAYGFAYSISYVTGVVASYFLNSIFVFQARVSPRKFFLYPVVYVAHYAFSLLALIVLVRFFEMSEMVAPLVVIALGFPLTYVLTKIVLLNW